MPAPDAPAADTALPGPLVIEADTAEEALGLVRERLGDDAEILEARKVHRGGWKGFFALERVELTARPRVPQPPPDPEGAGARQRLADEQARDRADFDRMLRRLLEPAPADPAPAEPAAAEPAPADPAPPGPPAADPAADPVAPGPVGVAWSRSGLEALRLPRRIVAACTDLAPTDDLAWVRAIAAAVGPSCRPLPAGPPAYVGPRLGRLARSLGVPLVRLGADAAPAGAVALEAPDTAEGRAWAARLAGDRWLHVVAGGRRWHGFVFEDALAVSWLGADQLPMALAVAERLGLVLGRGPGPRTGELLRPSPVDVALAVRGLLPRA